MTGLLTKQDESRKVFFQVNKFDLRLHNLRDPEQGQRENRLMKRLRTMKEKLVELEKAPQSDERARKILKLRQAMWSNIGRNKYDFG